MEYTRGSEWRRWDLHVHTPESGMANEFSDWDSYVKALFNKALENKIAAIGITDYFTIDGYKKLKGEYLNNESKMLDLFKDEATIEQIKQIKLFPNIEFRLDIPIVKGKEVARINYHIILSDEISIKNIEENFLHEIVFVYENIPNDKSNKRKLTKANLEELGNKIKEEQPTFKGSPFNVGCSVAVVNDEQITNILLSHKDIFEGKYLIVVPVDEDLSKIKWETQGHMIRKSLYQEANMFFSSNPQTRDFGLGEKCDSIDAFLLEFKSLKPCVHGSDAHSEEKMFAPDNENYCWIKADTTFEGLKQILIEPKNRVFIGKEPNLFKTVSTNRTKYIKGLFVNAVSGYAGTKGKWFENIQIPFNNELVAIIGNKGNGKSAISDIIAHCCNYKNQNYFSFLNDDKFRSKKLADNFEAIVTFEDGQSEKKCLSANIDVNGFTRVKYLPQGYFESICNDLQKEENLKIEIESVVFQYIDESHRLGASSFKELITKKTNAIERDIWETKKILSTLNEEIIALEDKDYPDYRNNLNAAIKQKENEIAALIVPIEVPPPNPNDEKVKETISQIELLKTDIVSLNENIRNLTDEQNSIMIRLSRIDNFIADANRLVQSFEEFKEKNRDFVVGEGANIDDIISITHNTSVLARKKEEYKNKLQNIDHSISPDSEDENNLVNKLKKKQEEIDKLREKLDGPSKAYHAYLQQKEEYDNNKKKIEGDENTPNSLNWLKKERNFINNSLEEVLRQKEEERDGYMLEIYSKHKEIIEIYQQVKSKLDAKILENQTLLKNYEIRIDASLGIKNSFPEDFLRFVNQSKTGSFRLKDSGFNIVQELIKDSDIQREEGIVSFCNSFIAKLKECNGEKMYIRNQVEDRKSLYDYLFSLDYLTNNYSIMQGSKELSMLSPGEKGALLLVFYLLLDMDNTPLILDQPEDNLDNDSVANILVDFIKEAKKKRQIIMVTHNPNLAVVADAEQIIFVHIDKENGNKVTVESGSIENPEMNKHIVDVLEGAMPAFRKRDKKYIK